jgi:serine/threonine-protein kinase
MLRLGAYDIGRVLGRGGMATVYEGRHATLGRRAAIKVLHSHLARDAVATARFLREGRAVARVRHPNIVDIFDSGQNEGVPYLVMELLEGDDLVTHVRRRHPLPIAEVADCLLPVIAAVAAAHAAGIVHRDLKPNNIRLAGGPTGAVVPKVLDFGISKWSEGQHDAALTETDSALGTTGYMSPEQLRSAKQVDARSDVYALGVILYECSTAKRPFVGDSAYDLMHAIVTMPLAPPSAARADLPPAFDTLVLRAMSRHPDDRFASARLLGLALAPMASDQGRWLGEFASDSTEPIAAPPKPMDGDTPLSLTFASASHRRTRRPYRLALSAVAACAATVGAAALLKGTTATPRPPVAVARARVEGASPSPPPPASDAPSLASEPVQVEGDPGPSAARLAIEPRTQGAQPPRARASMPVEPTAASEPSSVRTAAGLAVGTNGAPIVE